MLPQSSSSAHMGFILSPGATALVANSRHSRHSLSSRSVRTTSPQIRSTPIAADQRIASTESPSTQSTLKSHPQRKPGWPRVALVAIGTLLGSTLGNATPLSNSTQNMMHHRPVHAASLPSSTSARDRRASVALVAKSTSNVGTSTPNKLVPKNVISLDEFGIKRDDFLSERELRRRKTTQFSEAEQEIMELEEWEVETQWFRNLQMLWAGVASIAGMFVLYKGGVMWEKWIKEQERKDMEEEIELTGTFIDPRAVRKDEDGDPQASSGKPDGGKPSSGPSKDSSGSDPDDISTGDVESLEKLFGKS